LCGGNGSWASQTWANTYDNIDRLLTATGSTAGLYTYALDGPGNLTTWTATGGGSTSSPTYSNVNELTSGSHTYDNAGEETADSTRTYKYDAENRVIEIDYTGGSNKTTITYDGLGRRVQLAFYNGSTATTRFAWCGSQLCEERDGSDTILKRYYLEGEYTVSGTVKLVYMPDQIGSARDVVNASGPSVVYSEDFTPYGAAASTSGTATDFGYAGLFADQNSSLSYSATRFLDPASGRWIHRDPIAEKGGLDLFAYAAGNPVSNVDPDGLAVCVYDTSTEQISCYSTVPGDDSTFSGKFASGNNIADGCKNNPSCSFMPYIGPIPQGWWQWTGGGGKHNGRVLVPISSGPYYSPFGSLTGPFTPQDYRDSFRTHECSNAFGRARGAKGSKVCSEGCVTGDHDTVQQLNSFLDNDSARGQPNFLLAQ
jgi:RHS repeat-associated protein